MRSGLRNGIGPGVASGPDVWPSDGSGEIVIAASLVRGAAIQTPDKPQIHPDFDRRVWDYSGMAKVGKWFTVLGLVIMLAAVAVGVFFAATGFGKVADMAENAFVVEGSVTRDFDAGDGSSCSDKAPEPTTTDRTARSPVLLPPRTSHRARTTFTYDGRSVRSYQGVGFTKTGSYTIACDGYAVATPELSATGIFQSVGGILLAVSVVVADWFLWSSEAFCGLSGRAERSLRRRTRRPAATKAIRSRVGIRTIRSRAPAAGGYPGNQPPGNWNR